MAEQSLSKQICCMLNSSNTPLFGSLHGRRDVRLKPIICIPAANCDKQVGQLIISFSTNRENNYTVTVWF